METPQTLLVLGGTGQTGQHFIRLALGEGHRARTLARTPEKITTSHPNLGVVAGSLSDVDAPFLDTLLDGVDAVVAMLGNATAQQLRQINTDYLRELVPAMRRNDVARLLYQAGGLSAAPGKKLSLILRLIRATIARQFVGQHRDNEAAMRYLSDEAMDLEWMVHRAGIRPAGRARGTLHRSAKATSLATFEECAAYNLRTVMDTGAIHTCDTSSYRNPGRRDR